MRFEIYECLKSYIDIEGNIVFIWVFKFDIIDDEVDGFSLMNMKESDIFLMILGKVGLVRKMCIFIDKIKEIKRNVNEKLRDFV